MDNLSPVRIIRKKVVRERDGLSDTTRWRRIKEGSYPKPIRLGPNSVGWYEHEIDDYLASLPRIDSDISDDDATEN